MPVTEQLMASGSWTLRLGEHTPSSVRDLLEFFGHVVICPTHVNPKVGDAAMLGASARYTGVLRMRRNKRLELSGPGLAFWLGDEDGKGAVPEADVTIPAGSNLAAAIAALLPPAIAAGTISSPATVFGPWTTKFVTPRVAIDYVVNAYAGTAPIEWRINPDASIDVASSISLFVFTPKVVVMRRDGGSDIALKGLEVAELNLDEDVQDYVTRVFLLGSGGDTPSTGAANAAATPYKDLRGNAVVLTRVVSSPETPVGEENQIAAAELLKIGTGRQKALTLSTDTYDIGGRVAVGDWIWVFDPISGLVDAANEVRYRGQVIRPVKTRVFGSTWPVERGMGVYYRDKLGAYTDLTPYVAWETSATTLEVGARARASLSTYYPSPTRPDGSQAVIERPPNGSGDLEFDGAVDHDLGANLPGAKLFKSVTDAVAALAPVNGSLRLFLRTQGNYTESVALPTTLTRLLVRGRRERTKRLGVGTAQMTSLAFTLTAGATKTSFEIEGVSAGTLAFAPGGFRQAYITLDYCSIDSLSLGTAGTSDVWIYDSVMQEFVTTSTGGFWPWRLRMLTGCDLRESTTGVVWGKNETTVSIVTNNRWHQRNSWVWAHDGENEDYGIVVLAGNYADLGGVHTGRMILNVGTITQLVLDNNRVGIDLGLANVVANSEIDGTNYGYASIQNNECGDEGLLVESLQGDADLVITGNSGRHSSYVLEGASLTFGDNNHRLMQILTGQVAPVVWLPRTIDANQTPHMTTGGNDLTMAPTAPAAANYFYNIKDAALRARATIVGDSWCWGDGVAAATALGANALGVRAGTSVKRMIAHSNTAVQQPTTAADAVVTDASAGAMTKDDRFNLVDAATL